MGGGTLARAYIGSSAGATAIDVLADSAIPLLRQPAADLPATIKKKESPHPLKHFADQPIRGARRHVESGL